MTEEQVVESAQESSEVVEQPKPTVPSVPSGDEQPSAPSSGVDIIALEGMIDKKIQSLKDVRLDRVPKLEEKVNQLIELYEGETKPASSEVPGRTGDGEKAYMEAMSAQILEGAEIAFDDPEYDALVEQYGGKVTPEQWVSVTKAFAEKRATKGAKQEGVTEAAAATPAGTVVEVSEEAEEADLIKRLNEIRATGKGTVDKNLKEEREKIHARLEELTPQVKLDIR